MTIRRKSASVTRVGTNKLKSTRISEIARMFDILPIYITSRIATQTLGQLPTCNDHGTAAHNREAPSPATVRAANGPRLRLPLRPRYVSKMDMNLRITHVSVFNHCALAVKWMKRL